MWRAAAGHQVTNVQSNQDDDEWETDADFVNDTTEEEQRWGSKTIEGSGHVASFDMTQLREGVQQDHSKIKEKEFDAGPKSSLGYGGKFGVQKDRMDKSAVSHDYTPDLAKHSSQSDATKGFGGKFGVQTDRQDKAAVGYGYQPTIEKHASQKDYSHGFGGKYGVQSQNVDKSALGWDYKHDLEQHASQKDHSHGFGGKFGVQSENVDKSAIGWDYKHDLEKHASQKDYSKGFGGKFGVEKEKVDKTAVGWDYQSDLASHPSQRDMSKGFGGKFGIENENIDKTAHRYEDQEKGPSSNYEKSVPVASSAGAKTLKSRFEQLAKDQEQVAPKPAVNRPWKKKTIAEPEQQTPVVEPHKETSCLPDVVPYEPEDTYNTVAGVRPTSEDLTQEVTSDAPEVTSDAPEVMGDNNAEDEYDCYDDGELSSGVASHQETRVDEEEEENYDEARFAPEPQECVPEELYEPVVPKMNARALYDYQADGDDEISFDPDDIISNVEQVDEGWWQGECHGAVGLFPANYVELIS